MVLRTRGVPIGIEQDLVGRVTRNPSYLGSNSFLIADQLLPEAVSAHFLGVLTQQSIAGTESTRPVVHQVQTLDYLSEGDIVSVSRDGMINTLYRIQSPHNTLLVTERCNSNCLMCSQPPKDKDDIPRFAALHQRLIPLIPKDCAELGISGGEPTLLGDHFFSLLTQLKDQLPDTEIHVLTNGRSFAWHQLAQRLAAIDHQRVVLGIPLYSDYYQEHDYIVQANDAFTQTILGLHNLGRYNQRVEIRVVLHKLSIPRLVKLARFIYKNIPFAEHVAFMGLEYVGYTPHNIDKLWVDPYHYADELGEAVEFLTVRGLNVSIYNTPLCLLPPALWPYARKSISDWKNAYLPECNRCARLTDCGGLFTWNLKKPSAYIKPFEPDS